LVRICISAAATKKARLKIIPLDPQIRNTWDTKTLRKRIEEKKTIASEDTTDVATRKWIEEFVLRFLEPFRNLTAAEVRDAAAQDKFRYIGRLCKLRMIDDIRRQEYTYKYGDLYPSEEQTVIHVEPTDNWVGQSPEDALRSSLGLAFGAGSLGQMLQDNQKEFEKLLGKQLFIVLQVEYECYLIGLSKGDISRTVAERLDVKVRQAQRYQKQLREKMGAALKTNATTQELYGLLNSRPRQSILPHSGPMVIDWNDEQELKQREPKECSYLDPRDEDQNDDSEDE